MSGMEPLLLASLATTAVSTGLGVYSQIQQAKAQNSARESQAVVETANSAALEKQASDQRAASQAAAAEERRRSAAMLSQQRAKLAASGAGLDGDALDILGNTAALGETNAAMKLWAGENDAAATMFQAKQGAYRADVLRTTKTDPSLGIASTILGGVGAGIRGYADASKGVTAGYTYDTPDDWTKKTTVRYS